MSLIVTSLASGSNGNAFLVQAGSQTLLVEAGLTARALERHLRQRGVDPASLSAIIVSHEHNDHIHGVALLARRYGVPIVCSEGTATAMGNQWHGLATRPLDDAGLTVGQVDIWGFPVPHDATEPQGILLAYRDRKVGWALDLGSIPDHLVGCLTEADLVIIESNHDREKLIASQYSWALKHRILGDRGHLSNSQAGEFLKELGEDGRTRSVWLAHLSENTNEHPKNVLRYFENYLGMAGITGLKLQIAERGRPSAVWPSLQPSLFDSL